MARILVIEDERDLLKVLEFNLNQAGHEVLTAFAKGQEVDRIVGFELGADDYVVKPFSVRELLLRIDAILRAVEGR